MPRFHHKDEPYASRFEPVRQYLVDFFDILVSESRSSVDGKTLSDFYGHIFALCSQSGPQQEFPNGADWCYTQFQMLISSLLRNTIFPSLLKAHGTTSEAFLIQYVKLWTQFQVFLKSAIFVFDYLDQWHLRGTHYKLQIRAYELWAVELLSPHLARDISKKNTSNSPSHHHHSAPQSVSVQAPHLNRVSPNINEFYYNFCPIYITPQTVKPEISDAFLHNCVFNEEIDQDTELDDEWVLNRQFESAPKFPCSIQDCVIAAFLEIVAKDRANETIDRDLLKRVSQSFVDLGNKSAFNPTNETYVFFFYDFLELAFDKQIRSFYKLDINVRELGFNEYVQKLGGIFKAEENRVVSYFHSRTRNKTKRTLHEIVLKNTLNGLLEKPGAMAYYLNESNLDTTLTLFDMLSVSEDTLKTFCTRLQEYVSSVGLATIKKYNDNQRAFDEERQRRKTEATTPGGAVSSQSAANMPTKPDPVILVEQLIKLDEGFRHTVEKSCRSNNAVFGALRHASESFINQQETLISSTLAQYANSLLSIRGKRPSGSGSLTSQLASIAHIFRYLRNKDFFEQEYLVKLSSRLLSGASLGQTNEQEALKAIIAESGSDFSHKANGLLADLGVSRQFTSTFKKDRAELLARYGLDVTFFVCTSNSGWVLPITQYSVCYSLQNALHVPEPKSSAENFNAGNDFSKLPEVFRDVWAQFGQFYCQQHERRFLEYRLDEGICEVSYIPNPEQPQNAHILVCTPIMAVILMYLGSQSKFVLWKDLVAALGIEPKLLAEHLLPLCRPLDQPTKCIVRKSTQTQVFSDTDKILLSKHFDSNVVKVHIPFKRKETQKDIQKRDLDLHNIRLLSCNAVITRFLKMRKEATYNQIIAEAQTQLANRFTPTIELLKNSIEFLVAQDILERDAEDRNKYIYLA